MPAMLLFSAKPYKLDARAITSAIKDCFALTAYPWEKGEKAKNFPAPTDEGQSGLLFVELPELEEDEGDPIAQLEVFPRLDREQDLQSMIDEIVAQDKALDKALNKNQSDILITFDDSPAAFETACMAAYVIAEAIEGGVLIPAFEEGEETLWFDNADDFQNEIFQEEDGEEGDLEEEDGEEEEEDEDPKGRKR